MNSICADVRDFGTDGAAIQAAIDSLPTGGTSIGGAVCLPPGVYPTSNQIVVRNKVRLIGAGRDATTIKALPDFPPDTPVVRLGNPGDSHVFDCSLNHLKVDCDGIADIGVYSDSVNEMSGLYHIILTRIRKDGIFFEDTKKDGGAGRPMHFDIQNVEVLYSKTGVNPDAIGIRLELFTANFHTIERVTVNATPSDQQISVGILIQGCRGPMSGLHFENTAVGLRLGNEKGPASNTVATYISGTSNGTVGTVVEIPHASTQAITVMGIRPGSVVTKSLFDVAKEITLSDINGVSIYATGTGPIATRRVLHL